MAHPNNQSSGTDHSVSKSLPEAPSKRAISGADYFPKKDRWRSRIMFNRKVYCSPYYHTKQEAEDWYAAKSYELYGYDRVNDLQLKDPDVDTQGNSKAQYQPNATLSNLEGR